MEDSQSPRCVHLVETNLCHGWEPSPRPDAIAYGRWKRRGESVRARPSRTKRNIDVSDDIGNSVEKTTGLLTWRACLRYWETSSQRSATATFRSRSSRCRPSRTLGTGTSRSGSTTPRGPGPVCLTLQRRLNNIFFYSFENVPGKMNVSDCLTFRVDRFVRGDGYDL